MFGGFCAEKQGVVICFNKIILASKLRELKQNAIKQMFMFNLKSYIDMRQGLTRYPGELTIFLPQPLSTGIADYQL